MQPIDIRIQNFYTQTGVENPVFLWKYSEGNHVQTAYQIDIYQGGTPDSAPIFSTGKIMSGEQNNISLPLDLAEQSEYSFTVTAWDEDNRAERSEQAKFLTGVKHWQGKWIGSMPQ